MTRTTTTERTAVEQALVTQAARRAVAALALPSSDEQLVYVDTKILERCEDGQCSLPPYVGYLVQSLEEVLLTNGYRRAADSSAADVLVFPRIDYAAVDDSESLLGIPAISLPVPGVGTVDTPSLSLLSNVSQLGRVKLSLFAVDRASGKLVFRSEGTPGEQYYDRWTVLFLLGFRLTDLEPPF